MGKKPINKTKLKTPKYFQLIIYVFSWVLIIILAERLRVLRLWSLLIGESGLLKTGIYSVLIFFLLFLFGWLFRLALWISYRPAKISGKLLKNWPSVSVIMPAFNEEKSVARAIEAVLSSEYPEDSLELICVNDGSTDRTLDIMRNMESAYPGRIKIVDTGKNVGKKKAIALGLKAAGGEIIVLTDADSEMHKQAIRNLLVPLVLDKKVGAVAGKVLVLNEKKNLFTRMLAAQYAVSFDFGRAYQSVYGGVLCCPGALSAFRRSVLEGVKKTWLRQKFLNVECRHGEDRALTNLVLKKGYQVKYQSNALVYTRVPEKLTKINQMYLRWTRGYVRETWFLIKYFWRSRKCRNCLLPLVDSVLQMLMHPFHLIVVSLLIYSFIRYPDYIINQLFLILGLSICYSLSHVKAGRGIKFLYGIPQSVFVFFCQWWMVPYALITIRNQDWLTK